MPWSEVIRQLLKRPMAVVCGVIMVLFMLVAATARLTVSETALIANPDVDTVENYSARRRSVVHGELRRDYDHQAAAKAKDDKRTAEEKKEAVKLAEQQIADKAGQQVEEEVRRSPPAVTNLERSYHPPTWFLAFDKHNPHWEKTGLDAKGKQLAPIPLEERNWGFFDGRFWALPMGADIEGVSVLAKLIRGLELAFIIGLIPTLISAVIATFIGLASGYFGGFVDDFTGFVMSVLASIPLLLLLIAFIQAVKSSELVARWFETIGVGDDQRAMRNLILVLVVIGITTWIGLSRLVRAEVIKHKGRDYVIAARALGCGSTRILFKHILPNVFHLVIITCTLSFVGSVGLEVFLSFVGIGIDPNLPTWGQMIASARNELQRDPSVWWPLAGATIMLFGLSLSFSLFGDALRDALDPKLRT
ncbi:MAG: ABC transporter permease [Planctomycetes bacterium]|nr:ABC transporter permease [Planctomycetota bacterium]